MESPERAFITQPEQLPQPGDPVTVGNNRDEIWTLEQIKDEDGPMAYLRREENDEHDSREIFLKSRLENVHLYVAPAPEPKKRKAA